MLFSGRFIASGMVIALATTIPRGAASFTATTTGSGSLAAGSWCNPGSPTVLRTVEDSYIREDMFLLNYGTSSGLLVQSFWAAQNARILLKFDLPSIPTGCTISTAILTLKTTIYKSGRVYEVRRAAGGWSENGVSWANQPGSTGSASSAPSSSFAVVWDVTSQIAASYPTDRGLEIRDSSEDGILIYDNRFASREGATPPSLTVTFG